MTDVTNHAHRSVYCPNQPRHNQGMNALGAPLRHFGFNRWWAAFFGFGALMFGSFSIAAVTVLKNDSEFWALLVFVPLLALNVFLLVRTLRASATVCEAGIRYTTLRCKGEMLWSEVEKFRYSVLTTYHEGFIKTTQYTMILVDKDGQRAELGSNVEHPKELAALLCAKLHPLLLQKTIAAYDSGKTLDLGAVKLAREKIQMSMMGLRKIVIPATNVAGCSIDKGMLRIAERVNDKVKNHAVMLTSVDNAFALMEVVNNRMVQQTLAARSGR